MEREREREREREVNIYTQIHDNIERERDRKTNLHRAPQKHFLKTEKCKVFDFVTDPAPQGSEGGGGVGGVPVGCYPGAPNLFFNTTCEIY